MTVLLSLLHNLLHPKVQWGRHSGAGYGGSCFPKDTLALADDAKKEGRDEGRNEGRDEGRAMVAKQMLAEGESWDKITKYTGLTKEELEKLSQQH